MLTMLRAVVRSITIGLFALALSGCSSPPSEIVSPCDPERIERDLGVADDLVAADPTVPECTAEWAVIRWDAPGDNQRVVRRVDSTWVDYVRFPHDRCWSQAEADGVPGPFRPYFLTC